MLKKIIAIAVLILCIISISACQPKGVAEKAGEKIDQAIEKTSDKASEVTGAIKEKAEDISKAVKKKTQ
jgi:predicted small secreted protein